MPNHVIERVLPFSDKQLFDLVSDIENYPLFLPWCEAARIIKREGDVIFADLVVHFRGVTGKYTSRVMLNQKEMHISVELAEGPFEYLNQNWKFLKDQEGTCVCFDIDFKLHSFVLEKMMNLMFDQACAKMMDAFERRALHLYTHN